MAGNVETVFSSQIVFAMEKLPNTPPLNYGREKCWGE